jgi:hypothetical protein
VLEDRAIGPVIPFFTPLNPQPNSEDGTFGIIDVRREGRSCQVTSRPFSLLPMEYLRQGSDALRYFQLPLPR